MELRQLRQFVALAETGNFHRAAEVLHMTQPPLSFSIRKLEDELGGALFERHPRGVTLTQAGAAALGFAREALRAADEAAVAFRETRAGQRGRLRLGFVSSATWGLVPAIVPVFRSAHPGIDLKLKEATSQDVIRGLESGELDVGLVRTPAVEEAAAVDLRPLYREDLILMAPSAHPLGARRRIRLEELSHQDFIFYDRQLVPGLFNLMMMACQSAGFLPRIVEEASHIHTMISLVECGVGLALAPQVMRRAASERVACLGLTVANRPLQIGAALAIRRGDARPMVRAFAETAEKIAARLAG